jgi:hypothetical protein
MNRIIKLMAAILAIMAVTACSTESRQGAAQGAATGAAVGAVGGIVTALVFGGDVGNAAARGAVWGGSTGAASGAIQGAQVADRNKAAQQKKDEQELAKLQKAIGNDAYFGLEALVDCKLPVAKAYAETAQGNKKKDHALAGYWLEALVLAEGDKQQELKAMLPEVVAKDSKVASVEIAASELSNARIELEQIREYFGVKKNCS